MGFGGGTGKGKFYMGSQLGQVTGDTLTFVQPYSTGNHDNRIVRATNHPMRFSISKWDFRVTTNGKDADTDCGCANAAANTTIVTVPFGFTGEVLVDDIVFEHIPDTIFAVMWDNSNSTNSGIFWVTGGGVCVSRVTLKPSTCECEIIFTQGEFRNAKLSQRCRSHNSVAETMAHVRTLSTAPPERQQEEKEKPQFRR